MGRWNSWHSWYRGEACGATQLGGCLVLFGPWATGEGINTLLDMIDVAFGYDDGV